MLKSYTRKGRQPKRVALFLQVQKSDAAEITGSDAFIGD